MSRKGKLVLRVDVYTFSKVSKFQWVCSTKNPLGKTLILVDGYTFSQTSTYFWVCSTRLPGCKAKLRLENGFITDINNFHSHPSRKYVKSQKGTYVRVG
ncbi:hypothetical protein ABMA27_001328 [Loxostege sticticalis]|uniref:FLYWCH-type domain-containing protein n=1 Tax=Loxostege sticticalis TaxID=481309 RepID=A0ABR3HY22_LOXSC